MDQGKTPRRPFEPPTIGPAQDLEESRKSYPIMGFVGAGSGGVPDGTDGDAAGVADGTNGDGGLVIDGNDTGLLDDPDMGDSQLSDGGADSGTL